MPVTIPGKGGRRELGHVLAVDGNSYKVKLVAGGRQVTAKLSGFLTGRRAAPTPGTPVVVQITRQREALITSLVP